MQGQLRTNLSPRWDSTPDQIAEGCGFKSHQGLGSGNQCSPYINYFDIMSLNQGSRLTVAN